MPGPRAAVLALAFALAAAPFAAAQDEGDGSAPAARDAQLTKIEGTVYLHPEGAADEEFVPAEEGALLQAGDMVRTGVDGKAELTLDGESVISIQPNTDFIVNSLDRSGTEFHLGAGTFLAKIKSLLSGERMEFRTATSVAAVRGTEFALAYEDGSGANLGVFDEGRVGVRPAGTEEAGEVVVGPNQETTVARGGGAPQVGALRGLAGLRSAEAGVRERAAFQQSHWKRPSAEQRRQSRARLMSARRVQARNLAGVRADRKRRAYKGAARRRTALRMNRARRAQRRTQRGNQRRANPRSKPKPRPRPKARPRRQAPRNRP